MYVNNCFDIKKLCFDIKKLLVENCDKMCYNNYVSFFG